MADDLDDLLDSALADFGLTEKPKTAAPAGSAAASSSAKESSSSETGLSTEDLVKSLGGLPDAKELGEFADGLQEFMKTFNNTGDMQKALEAMLAGSDTQRTNQPATADDPSEAIRAGVAQTLSMLADSTRAFHEDEAAASSGANAESLPQFLEQLSSIIGNASEDTEVNSMLEGFIKQLLTKDVLYQPMKDLEAALPDYLEKNKDTLDADDVQRYTRLLGVIRLIITVFDDDPDNSERLMELMHEMQECGQPPLEVLQTLYPENSSPDDVMRLLGMEEGADKACSVM